ncbi:Gfo/Idh/MocA family protein [Thiorhodovibrio frisius]|uniref:Putative dehydrogenase n=1 Tax=Thiorhodovibrio frisius TaxID=631362 RepID=H8Z4D6_9GAMM|nr:Gfo/Idh/MocA family oxidoreductase [Thiorhodovibrio frisius]EIC20193.1 putative dehydrogenase [Thiorhodovibrio frisius]WPL20931.1 Putative oxidoreductase YteT precursor [Thiorhodovibrio frisius]
MTESRTKAYRLALIGLGRVAWLLERDPLRTKPCTHLGAWLERDDVELVGACDTDPERRAAFAEFFPEVPLYDDYQEMLEQERPELLSICAYATERCEMVLAATEGGVRGIWCEKAMATSLEEADRMARALDASGTQMIVAFTRRWSPAYATVRDWLAAGRIGAFESVNVHFASNLLHTGTHAFDVLRLWCGEPTAVRAWLDDDSGLAEQSGYRFDGQDIVEDLGGLVVIEFPDGVRATVQGRDKGYFRFEFELLGSRGMIRLGNDQRQLWLPGSSMHFAGFMELCEAEFPEPAPFNTWRSAAENLIAAVEGRAESACGIRDGREALAIALAAHVSHRQGGAPVAPAEVPTDLRVPSR